MKCNIDSVKPYLIMDISMNEVAKPILETLLKYECLLPDGKKNLYYINKYKYLQNKFFLKFSRILKTVEVLDYSKLEDISFEMMDQFYEYVKNDIDEIKIVINDCLSDYKNDEDNFNLLKMLQLNNILIQYSQKLYKNSIGKNSQELKDLFEINTRFILMTDDKKSDFSYSKVEKLKYAVDILSHKILKYKFKI